jgi:hypothetical protein
MQNGGERGFLEPLVRHFGETRLTEINQLAVERTARVLFPKGGPATINRQGFTPVSAILRHGAVRGLCYPVVLRRPKQPKGRVRWRTQEKAAKLIEACAPHLRPRTMFLFLTGTRLEEAPYLN